MTDDVRKTLTIRLSAELYQSAAELARRRGVSLNRLVQEGLSAVIQGEEFGRLYDAFGLVGTDGAGLSEGSAHGTD